MRTVNSFSGGTGQGQYSLPRPVSFPENQRCSRIRVEAAIPLKNNGGGSYTLTNSDAVDIMRKYFDTFTMTFGDRATDQVDIGLSFDEVRLMNLIATGADVIFNGKLLKNYSSSDSDAIAIGAGATGTATCELIRPFIFTRFDGSHMTEWCPGSKQMRQLALWYTRSGTAFTANSGNIVQISDATNTVLFDTITGDYEAWVQVYRWFRNNDAGLQHGGPPGGGGLIALAEVSGGTAANYGQITLSRSDDTADLHYQTTVARLSRDHQLLIPPGASDPTTVSFYNGSSSVTPLMLYALEQKATEESIPTSSHFTLLQTGTVSMQSRWLYVPVADENFAHKVGVNIVGPGQPPVKLVPAPTHRGELEKKGHTVAISGLSLIGPDHPDYATIPGAVHDGQKMELHVPPALQGAIKAKADAAGAQGDADMVKEVKNLAKFFPGGRAAKRGGNTGTMVALAKKIDPGRGDRVSGQLGRK